MKFISKILFFFVLFILGSQDLKGQTDAVKTKAFKSNLPNERSLLPKKDPNELPNFLKVEFFKGVSNSNKNNPYFDRPDIDMSMQENFTDPGTYYLEKLKTPESNRNPVNYKVDQYLGDFKSNAPYVQVIFRDHEVADGDRVRILYNDREVEANVLLQERFKKLNVSLIPGFNKIEFIALNQGESGPNTAEIRVYDNEGGLLMANQWNLATGNKATLIVVKE